jgi:single-stranded DNA-binding protein
MLNMMFAGNVGGDADLREVSVRGETVKVANFVKKGDRVVITADNIKTSTWTTAEGETRASLEVSARRVDFTGNRRNNTSNEPPF